MTEFTMNNDQPARPAKNGLARIISLVLFTVTVFVVIMIVSGGFRGFTVGSKKKNIEAAEKYANQKFYYSVGIAPERLTSDVIYHSGDDYLIVVKYYLPSSYNVDGSMCVHCRNGIALSSTSVMPPAYDFKGSINELKALFGI